MQGLAAGNACDGLGKWLLCTFAICSLEESVRSKSWGDRLTPGPSLRHFLPFRWFGGKTEGVSFNGETGKRSGRSAEKYRKSCTGCM